MICVSISTGIRLTALIHCSIVPPALEPPTNCRETADKLPITEQEQQIHKFALENGSISTAQAVELLGVKQRRAREILGKMVDSHWLRKEGASRSTVYVMNTERR